MADITSNVQKINDLEVSGDAPVTEALLNKIGGTINGLVDFTSAIKVTEFTASGNWVCPAGVTKALFFGTGGGGGGGNPNNSVAGIATFGEGGCAGNWGLKVSTVVPGTTYAVVVGGGGAAATNGSDTTVSALSLTWSGGRAGRTNAGFDLNDVGGSTYEMLLGGSGVGAMFSGRGESGPYGNGGTAGTAETNNAPSAGAANSGAGGGGGVRHYADSWSYNGAAGGSGRMIVVYLSMS